ncbi:OmpA family protein [Sphingomonas sp.]|uniref:OmpA family protein n=1 Tax=Sphingomonas sp. TaxID=28214 RepID=UPI0035B1F66B
MTMLRHPLGHPLGLCVLLGLSLAGCEKGEPANTAAPANAADTLTPPLAVPSPTPEGEVKSIIRPAVHAEVAEAPEPEAPPEPLLRVIGFPRSAALDEPARAALDALAEEAKTRDGPIVLRGHSDSQGSDKDNMRTARRRAEVVRDYLVEKGVPKERITVIALGEARPIAPNAKLDGSDDPEGRARNRRVEVEIGVPVPAAPAPAATPTPSPSPAG